LNDVVEHENKKGRKTIIVTVIRQFKKKTFIANGGELGDGWRV
jgi:hypothetical protein